MVYAPKKKREIIDSLYSRYQANGFISEDETLDLMIEYCLPLSEVDRVTEQLLAMGVLIRDEPDDLDDSEEGYDRTRTNYDEIFSRVIEIDPGLSDFIEEIRAIQAPQNREWRNLLPQAKAGNEYAYNRLFRMYLMLRDRAYYRYQRYRTIRRKTVILKSLGGCELLDAWIRGKPGRLAKGKIHCSCPICRVKSYDELPIRDRKWLVDAGQQELSFPHDIFALESHFKKGK